MDSINHDKFWRNYTLQWAFDKNVGRRRNIARNPVVDDWFLKFATHQNLKNQAYFSKCDVIRGNYALKLKNKTKPKKYMCKTCGNGFRNGSGQRNN